MTHRKGWRRPPRSRRERTAWREERKRWESGVADRCQSEKVGAAQRHVIESVVAHWFDNPHMPEVTKGYGQRGSKEGLAEASRHSRRTAIRAMKTAGRLGLVKVTHRGGHGRKDANKYALESLTPPPPPEEPEEPPTPAPVERPAGWVAVMDRLKSGEFSGGRRGPPESLH